LDDQRRDGGTNSTLRTKEQGTHLTLKEHDDDEIILVVLLTVSSYLPLVYCTTVMANLKLASRVMTNALHTFMYYCVTDSISVKIYGS